MEESNMDTNKANAVLGEILGAMMLHMLEAAHQNGDHETVQALQNPNVDSLHKFFVKHNTTKLQQLQGAIGGNAQPKRKVLANQPISQGGAPTHPRNSGNAPRLSNASTEAANLFRERQ
jgi:hypothetical protein